MDGLESNEPRKRSPFTREQKVGFALVLLIGLFGVVFGVKSFPASLNRPFELQFASYTGPEFLTPSQEESREAERQKTADTDEDGLVDYDELYVYKTSPYLADSDSDGFDDKTELYSGNDPNCPTGKDCGRTLVQSADAASSKIDTTGFLSGVLNVDPSKYEGLELNSVEDIQKFFAAMGVEEVRAILKSQGVSQETIDQISDEQIMELFTSAIEQANAAGALEDIVNTQAAMDAFSSLEEEAASDEATEE